MRYLWELVKSYEYDKYQLNDGDRDYGAICGTFSQSLLIYLIEFEKYPKDLWIELDRIFGKHNEDCYRNMGSKFRTTRVIYSKVSASTLSDEIVQDEEEAKSSSQSIRIKESILGVTPSPTTLKVYEISDISYPHMTNPKEGI